MLLSHHRTCEGGKTCVGVAQYFKLEISSSTTSKLSTNYQPQDPRVGYKGSQYQLAFVGEDKSFNSFMDP
jgi:hypothetical protein